MSLNEIPKPQKTGAKKKLARSSVRSLRGDSERIQGPVVTVMVGTEKKPFEVHESIICASSPFFRRAMSGPWKESIQRSVDLPEDEPKIFALYSYWLYYAKIPVRFEDATKNKPGVFEIKEYRDLIKAYVLGDKLLDTKFQNSVIDAIVETCSDDNWDEGTIYYPDRQEVNYAYENTIESSKIRSLLVDMWVRNAEAQWFQSPNYPKEFLVSIVKEFIEESPAHNRRPLDASNCYVYESGNDNGNSKP